MKNACIAVLGSAAPLSESGLDAPLAVLAAGGIVQDKIFLIGDAQPREFAQTFAECKNFFENVFVFVPDAALTAYAASAAEIVKTAPAPLMEAGQKSFFILPLGKEGERAAAAEVLPYFEKKYGMRRACTVLRYVGAPKGRAEELAAELRRRGAFTVRYSERCGDGRMEIAYDASIPKNEADDVLRLCVAGLNDYLYALEDTPLHVRVAELLKLRGKRVSAAESFTGGGIVRRLVQVPGVSSVLYEGIVAYSNEAKRRRLGVREETLQTEGAVSDQTAYEMAAGLIAGGHCDISVASTGIAGPASDNTKKPVGLCYLAVGTAESVYVYKYQFDGSREEITERAIVQALFLLYKYIK